MVVGWLVWRTQRFSLLKKVLTIFKTVDLEVSQRFNFTTLTRFCFLAIYMYILAIYMYILAIYMYILAIYLYILALYSTCCQLWCLRSNRQNSHRLLLENFRPLNHSAHCKMNVG